MRMENRVKLNNEKCKELRISFAKNKPQLAPIEVNNQELECVERKTLDDNDLNQIGHLMNFTQRIISVMERMRL